jgi:hypothetical protein
MEWGIASLGISASKDVQVWEHFTVEQEVNDIGLLQLNCQEEASFSTLVPSLKKIILLALACRIDTGFECGQVASFNRCMSHWLLRLVEEVWVLTDSGLEESRDAALKVRLASQSNLCSSIVLD